MIGLIFIGNIEYCPYLEHYLNLIESSQHSYEVLFWKRRNLNPSYPNHYYYFDYPMSNSLAKIKKLKGFIKYSIWIRKRIHEIKYDKLIILSTLPGILIANVLRKDYSKKYIFDIRDYSFEKYKTYLKIENKIIKNSFMSTISSPGFLQFLPPNYDYILAHNFLESDLNVEVRENCNGTKKIVISWMGVIRYFDHQIKIINHLKNDERFTLEYNGDGHDTTKLKGYCTDNGIGNVVFTGRYDNKQKSILLKRADILLNHYDKSMGAEVEYALSNKFYDGVIYGIPQIVETDTYKGHLVEDVGVGISLDVNDMNFADKIYEYYIHLDRKEFLSRCEGYKKKVIEENNMFIDKTKEFIEI